MYIAEPKDLWRYMIHTASIHREVDTLEYLRDTIGYQMLWIVDQMREAMRPGFRKIGITSEDYITLHYIYENPGISQIELARKSRKDCNVISKRLDKLEHKGLARRVKDPGDRRAFSVYPTEEGEGIAREHWPTVLQCESKSMDCLTKAEQDVLKQILEKLTKQLKES